MNDIPWISVIIVNYNVKEYLEQTLLSLKRACRNITHEVFVIDNASVDGSVQYIRQRFPEIFLIENKENIGFGRANNIVLKQARGKFMVLINPDTVVQEDTFEKLLHFFEENPDAGAATCKIINPDGSFSVDCRHSVPTPMIAFWKAIGLSRLFPKSKIFAKYNLTYLNPDETYPVPAISGSFMMIRKNVLDQVGFFDERFFMYCEDIDLCHRINQAGFKIYYVPTTQIIHYKGESTKKNKLDYVITFNKALYQFFQKYYAQRSIFLFRWIIVLGIVARAIFIYLKNFVEEHFPLILDVVLLNGVMICALMGWFGGIYGASWQDFLRQYWVVNLCSTIVFLGSAYYWEVYPYHRLSIQSIIKTNTLTFVLLACLTFFLNQLAFSRMVVLLSAFLSSLTMVSWRGILKRFHRGDKSVWGKDWLSKQTIIVGSDDSVSALYQKIQEMNDISYELVGVVTIKDSNHNFIKDNIPLLGYIENLAELIAMYRIRQVIFASEALKYEDILQTMSRMGIKHLEYKIAPSNMEVMIGKSSIERLDEYPLIDIDYAVRKPFNRFFKRLFDICISCLILILFMPVAIPVILWSWKSKQRVRIFNLENKSVIFWQFGDSHFGGFINKWILIIQILRGHLSFVGAPVQVEKNASKIIRYGYKSGLTGLAQLNCRKNTVWQDVEKYHLFYLKNQSFFLDIEILIKFIFRKISKNEISSKK